MQNFDLHSKLMLVLGIVGGIYTLVYGVWVWKTKDQPTRKPTVSENEDSE